MSIISKSKKYVKFYHLGSHNIPCACRAFMVLPCNALVSGYPFRSKNVIGSINTDALERS